MRLPVAELLSIAEALRLVLARASPLAAETVSIEAAAGRVLAEDATARVDLPPFPSSAMDGYAVRAAETPGALRVSGRVAAGAPAALPLGGGEAMGIATGGVVPEGADAVAPIEVVVERDNGTVEVASVDAGAHIRGRGSDIRAGDVVVRAGIRLGPAHLGALAAAGVAEAWCRLRPRATVVATGSELRPPGAPLGPGEIYEANGLILETQLARAGAEVERLPAVPDDEDAHRRALSHALAADVVVTSGGVSVGPHDLVRRVEAELGVEEVFWRVAVKPGKPFAFGVRGSTLVFGLPGNPVSALVGFELFVRPAVLALQGIADPRPPFRQGTLRGSRRRSPERDELVRARLRPAATGSELEPLTGQESHMIAQSAEADALVLVPRGEGELPDGAEVDYLPLS
jgi:molybdopterin molybdotransferase